MNNVVEKFEKEQITKLTSKKNIPTFRSGDTLKVTVKIVEGERSRLQVFEGICIARKNNSLNSKFTVRKISHGEGVEKVFPLFSPSIEKIEVIRKGNVNRAKLYYLKKRTGKGARIADRDRGDEIDQYSMKVSEDLSSADQEQDSENNQNVEKEDVNQDQSKDINKDKASQEVAEAIDLENKEPEKEKSELPASEADKTEDESK